MQKLIAKYGLAAHLALLAVAPLFLFPFCSPERIATVQLWLSLYAFVWTLLSPSVRHRELPHQARYRVTRSVARDPLFWTLIALSIISGVRALNQGVALAYDAENMTWKIADAALSFWPASAGSAGYPSFVAVVTLLVLLTAVRHALGRSARYAVFLLSSILAGLAACIALMAYHYELPSVRAAVQCGLTLMSYVGLAFAIHFLGSIVALTAAFERKWNRIMPFFALAIGGTAAGAFAFSPVRVIALGLLAGVLVLAYAFAYARQVLRTAGEFRYLVVFVLSLVLGGLLVYAILPSSEVAVRLQVLVDRVFWDEGFLKLRGILSDIAQKAWMGSPWFGTGIGSFSLDIRFHALASDWSVIPHGTATVPNGFLFLLAERGIIGVLVFALPFCFLVFTFVRRALAGFLVKAWPHPTCWVGPVALAMTVVAALFDASLLRMDVEVALCAALALSAGGFHRVERESHGG